MMVKSLLVDVLISDAACIEVLAYVAYCEGRNEQLIHNDALYKHVMFAGNRAMSDFSLFVEANALKAEWVLKPKLVKDFMKRYNLR